MPTAKEKIAANMKRIDRELAEREAQANREAQEAKREAEQRAANLKALKQGVPIAPLSLKQMMQEDEERKLDAFLDEFNEPEKHYNPSYKIRPAPKDGGTRKRTRRIKGGRFFWNNKNKSEKSNFRDCKRWNNAECTTVQIKKFNYPGRTNIGRIPTLKTRAEMTKHDYCEALPGISANKLKYLNEKLVDKFEPEKNCETIPMHELTDPRYEINARLRRRSISRKKISA